MIVQVVANGAVASAIYVLIGTSFGQIYRVTRFFHFAHGIVFTAGAYLTLLLSVRLGLPMGVGIGLSIGLCAVLGCLMDIGVYRPLWHKGASPLVLLLGSLGMYIVLQNLVSMLFGDDTKTIRSGAVREGVLVFGARVTPVQIGTIVTSVVLVTTLWLFLRHSKMGRAMRAVAVDPALAEVCGIDSDRVILRAFAIGSGLAGIAGVLVALDVDMTPTMGMNALMMGVVAVIVGGVGSIPGVALGALLLGMAQHLGVWFIGSQWKDAIAFGILVVFLLFRPQGFLGRPIKMAGV